MLTRRNALLGLLERFREAATVAEKWRIVAPTEAQLRKKMAVAFTDQGAAFLKGLEEHKAEFNEAGRLREAMSAPDWVEIFDEAAQSSYRQFLDPLVATAGAMLEAGASSVLGQMGLGIAFSLSNPRAVQYINQHGAANVRNINNTTRAYLQTVISQGVAEGWSYAQMASAIKSRYSQFAVGVPQQHIRSRAELIAVTEAGMGYEAGSSIVVRDLQDAGLRMMKQWLTVGDSRVDPHCRANQEQGWIPFDEPFASGDMNPLAHPACRCTALYQRDPKQVAPLPEHLQPEPEPEPEPPPAPTHHEDGFPNDLSRLTVDKTLGGSTGAQLVTDPVDGQQYVMKRGKDAAHLRNEALTDQAYQALGVNVPPLRLYEEPGGPVKLAKFIPGETLDTLERTNPRAYAKAVKKVQDDFAADALLGNWDVVGLSKDNILVDKKGEVWRIDNGGGLLYRGMGTQKAVFDQYPLELWTMRDPPNFPYRNPTRAQIFGQMKYEQVVKQMAALEKKRADLLLTMPTSDLRDIMAGRLDTVKDLVATAKVMTKDNFAYDYLNDFAYHSVNLRQKGIIAQLPEELKFKEDRYGGFWVEDKSGQKWDALRSSSYGGVQRSITADVKDYVNNNGGNWSIVREWAEQQKGDSWNERPRAFKYWVSRQREGVDDAKYYWRDSYAGSGVAGSKYYYDQEVARYGADTYHQSFASWHAFNYEFMRNVEFDNNNIKKGTVRLIRTENHDVMNMHNMKVGDTGVIQRGAAESTSIFRKYELYGNQVTRQSVAHHRVFGVYFMEREPQNGDGFFLGDHENEIVAMLEGAESKYEKYDTVK